MRALISVSDKTGVVEFAKGLRTLGWEVIATGGTMKLLADSGVEVINISDVTGFPEICDGRVKTLHPNVHGGLLARRDDPEHLKALKDNHIEFIDMVCVNLYPFRETISKPGVKMEDAYKARYFDDIMARKTAETAKKTESGVVERIRQRGARPSENGTNPGGAAVLKTDVSKLTPAQCEELERRGLQIPVLIGGATTSDVHTAVKIAPTYSGPVIHADNASRNNKILGELLGPGREEYLARVREEQQALRDQYRRREEIRTILPFGQVRKLRVPKPASEIAVPAHTGRLVFPDVNIADVEPLIDWNFFFPAWGLKGRCPDLFDHPERGDEARKLFDDAQALLHRIADERLLTLQGVVGIYPAVSRGDDILLTDAKGRRHTLPMLRNQTRGAENLCLSDFIADRRDGATDYIGAFALTAGIGLQELCDKFRSEGDDYSAIMAKLLADRLTEAFAEVVHSFVRRQMWGYETAEAPTPQQVIAGEYRGRRMAFGYPASPDHSLKREIFDLLAVEQTTRMRLTENWMISPGEALCGLFFSDTRYFSVGQIDAEQLRDYAERRGLAVETVEKIIPNNV